MRLSRVAIKNFRGIAQAEIELERNITVLVGENNTGKTTVLEALRLALETVRSDKVCNFSELDFYRDEARQELSACEPISITLSFIEEEGNEWPEHITQELNEVIVGEDYSVIKLRVTAEYDMELGEPRQYLSFLDDADDMLPGRERAIRKLRQLRPFFFQRALRAAKDQFHGQSTYWASFLKSGSIDDATRQDLEGKLHQIHQEIVDSHVGFQDVIDEVEEIADFVDIGESGEAVSVDPVSTDLYSVLRYGAEVNLLAKSEAWLPLRSHGEGTQSLSVLLLFRAYLKTRLQAEFHKDAEPIIAIEEPEAHLHPNAIRTVWRLVSEFPGQIIMTTHSGEIVSEAQIKMLRRMICSDGHVECRALPKDPSDDSKALSDERERRNFRRYVQRVRGDLLLARRWLLVEGESDAIAFSGCARLLDIDLHRHGVCFVEYSQAQVSFFLKVADDLGICWHVVADNDKEGKKHYMRDARDFLKDRPEENHISNLDPCLEGYLRKEGGYEVGSGGGKIEPIYKVLEMMEERMVNEGNKAIPGKLRDIVNNIITLED